jgi:hypothetical protein
MEIEMENKKEELNMEFAVMNIEWRTWRRKFFWTCELLALGAFVLACAWAS